MQSTQEIEYIRTGYAWLCIGNYYWKVISFSAKTLLHAIHPNPVYSCEGLIGWLNQKSDNIWIRWIRTPNNLAELENHVITWIQDNVISRISNVFNLYACIRMYRIIPVKRPGHLYVSHFRWAFIDMLKNSAKDRYLL